jgi:hypothetical protein
MSQIHWTNPIGGDFSTAADWGGDVVPGPGDDAILDAPGTSPYTVTSSANRTVAGIAAAATATLAITGGTFSAKAGTDGGADAGAITVGNGAALAISGVFDDTGAAGVTLQSTTKIAALIVGAAGATLTGGGTVSLGAGPYGDLRGASPAATLTNTDDTISGSGYIGLKSLTLDNATDGVIAASGAQGLLIDTAGETLTNAGLIEAGAGSAITLAGTTIANSGGTILAQAGGRVALRSADIAGGTLESQGSGVILASDNGSLLDGTSATVTIAAGSRVVVGNGHTLTAQGVVDNHGVVQVIGGELLIADDGSAGTTLSAGGQVELGNGGTLAVSSIGGLANDGAISGSGTIDTGSGLENGGFIYASNSATLTIAGTISNLGIIESTSSADVNIGTEVGAGDGFVDANGGTMTVNNFEGGFGRISAGGTLTIENSPELQSVKITFEGSQPTGKLVLGDSRIFVLSMPTMTINRFAVGGGTVLDLRDIPFVSAGEATYQGAEAGGVLTVTASGDTTKIYFLHYAGIAAGVMPVFMAESDGAGGTDIVALAPSPSAVQHFAVAMTSFAPERAAATGAAGPSRSIAPLLLAASVGEGRFEKY